MHHCSTFTSETDDSSLSFCAAWQPRRGSNEKALVPFANAWKHTEALILIQMVALLFLLERSHFLHPLLLQRNNTHRLWRAGRWLRLFGHMHIMGSIHWSLARVKKICTHKHMTYDKVDLLRSSFSMFALMNIKIQMFQPQRTKTLGGEEYLACTVWFTNLVLTAVAVSNFILHIWKGGKKWSNDLLCTKEGAATGPDAMWRYGGREESRGYGQHADTGQKSRLN